MKLLILSILMLCNACIGECQSQSYSTGDKGLYIFEYFPKIYGQAILCFIKTQDAHALKISFKVYYTKDKISKVIKIVDDGKYKYQKKTDGNIYVNGLNVEGYSSGNFKEKKIYSNDFYALLSSTFFDIDNKERISILNKLSK